MPERGGLLGWAERTLAERLDVQLVSASEQAAVQERIFEADAIRGEAEDLGYHAMQYFQGRPQEMRHWTRVGLYQRSRYAFGVDPLAGREVQLYGDFALGRGVGVPQAVEQKVQKIIDRYWNDPQNQEELTSSEAQRTLSNDLRTQSNALLACYEKGGKVRFGWLDVDTITDVVPDPEYRRRAIYYVGRLRKFRWDAENDRPAIEDVIEDGVAKKVYYKHWRNFEMAEKEREENPDLEPLPEIPEDKQDKSNARVLHIRVNRLGEQQFGIPFFARHLRFLSAMNEFTEARVEMARASATLIARRSVHGTPDDVVKQASALLSQVGEIGAGREFEGAQSANDPFLRGRTEPGYLTESDAVKTESLSLNSGAGNAQIDAQIIRSPIAAAAGLGQHLLGDAGNTNLATASTLELPTTMGMLSWQDVLEAVYRWATDRAVEAAVRNGELGGQNDQIPEDGEDGTTTLATLVESYGEDVARKPISAVCLEAPTDKALAQDRTGLDLSYDFQMPFPGRRNLDDVMTLAEGTLAAIDPKGEKPKLRQVVLRFLLTHGFEHPNPERVVRDVVPDDEEPVGPPGVGGAAMRRAGLVPAGAPDPSLRSQYGERKRTLGPDGSLATEDDAWLPENLRAAAATDGESAATLFRELVGDPSVLAALTLNGGGSE